MYQPMMACFRSLAKQSINRNFTINRRWKATLPALPYDYAALEPTISGEIMELHHTKHHQAYVNNLNEALVRLDEAKERNDFKTIISLGPIIRFNGGGHINHSIFWQVLSPNGARLSKLAISVQGSGWAWLGMCPISGKIRSVACSNQDPLESTYGLVPLFGIDVWEHAYYLQYKNVRADYVQAIWNVVNWSDVERRYMSVKPTL
ncbi:Superoxide dismutase [Mn], mitochondrial [Blomia tropicalis]|nr:Superoxide dismutase [Mn], mitochondrial [Blomia tropicalis]